MIFLMRKRCAGLNLMRFDTDFDTDFDIDTDIRLQTLDIRQKKDMEELRQFILNVKESDTLWLLEAKPGLFAMVEDGDENSYIPVWADEDAAKNNISDDWEEYNVASMNVDEFVGWMNELHEDNIGIAISSGSRFLLARMARCCLCLPR